MVKPEAERHHTRTKSSVLRSLIHMRPNPNGANSTSITAVNENRYDIFSKNNQASTSILPNEYSLSQPLGELQNHQKSPISSSKASASDAKYTITSKDSRPLHKKTLSVISLRSLAGRDGDKSSKSRDVSPSKPKKAKSSTNLATLLSRPKSRRDLKEAVSEDTRSTKDKENMTPPNLSPTATLSEPPIYAQFSSQQFATQPLGGKFLEDQIDLHTPHQDPPGKGRHLYDGEGRQPTLNLRRPVPAYLPSSFSVQDITRPQGDVVNNAEQIRPPSSETPSNVNRKSTMPEIRHDTQKISQASQAASSKIASSRGNPVKVREIKDVAAEFEAMLDRRNIPENQRYKMRSIAESIKIDMIRQDWAETAAAAAAAAAAATSHVERPGTNPSRQGNNSVTEDDNKVKRPRSRGFTLTRSNKYPTSPSKKAKPEFTLGRHTRAKSAGSASSDSTALTPAGGSVASTILAKAKGQLPDDFVNYLRKVQQPEKVEVGKLHKLRLLLRNETVAWTDNFIGLGGMKEIVGLLHRTLKVEWREEHEDALLHEVLLCLKALCTTALALEHLNDIQQTIFPALIHMIFDKEKKGPSEFTTRNIVTSLLFTYLKSAAPSERPQRARILLTYLRDPTPREEERPVPFVLEMHRERPFRVWNKEVVDVTKEVFWIFLHSLNTIALPPPEISLASGSSLSLNSTHALYNDIDSPYAFQLKHFPTELPPVAAAPYVGGVEWDATNYLASHLDLMNGILASLETRVERNAIREQLLISGWERCMGGTLRTCKEKFYGGVHAALRCWVAASIEDGWDTADVRCGPRVEPKSPTRKIGPKKNDELPKLDILKLDFGLEKLQENRNRSELWLL